MHLCDWYLWYKLVVMLIVFWRLKTHFSQFRLLHNYVHSIASVLHNSASEFAACAGIICHAQHCHAQHCHAQHCHAQHCHAQHCHAQQHSTAMHSTAMHSTAMHSTAMQSTASGMSKLHLLERANYVMHHMPCPAVMVTSIV